MLRKWFLRCDKKSTSNDTKVGKLDFIKIKNIYVSNNTIKKAKALSRVKPSCGTGQLH